MTEKEFYAFIGETKQKIELWVQDCENILNQRRVSAEEAQKTKDRLQGYRRELAALARIQCPTPPFIPSEFLALEEVAESQRQRIIAHSQIENIGFVKEVKESVLKVLELQLVELQDQRLKLLPQFLDIIRTWPVSHLQDYSEQLKAWVSEIPENPRDPNRQTRYW